MTPLQLTDDEMSVLRRLAEPIDPQRRPLFLQEVAAELEAKRQAGEIGEGVVHRVARTLQRKFFDPPQSPNASKAAGHRARDHAHTLSDFLVPTLSIECEPCGRRGRYNIAKAQRSAS
jgi:hypothetical protein